MAIEKFNCPAKMSNLLMMSIIVVISSSILLVQCIHAKSVSSSSSSSSQNEGGESELNFELMEMLSRLKAQVSQLQEQRAEDNAQLKQLQEAISKRDQVQNPGLSLQRLKSQLQSLKSELTTLIATKEREVDGLTGVRELRLELDAVHSECQKLRSDVQLVKDRRDEDVRLMGQQRNSQVTIKWLQKTVDEIRKEMNEVAAAQNVSAAMRLQQQFETGISLLRSDVVALRTQMEESRVAQDRDAATLIQVQQDVVDLHNQNHQMGANAQFFREELSQFKDELLTVVSSSSKRKPPPPSFLEETGATAKKPQKSSKDSSEFQDTNADVFTVDLRSFFNPVTHHRIRHHGKIREELEEVKSALKAVYKRQTLMEAQLRKTRHNHSVIASDVHHLRGRIGDLLNNTRFKVAHEASVDRSINELRADMSTLVRAVSQNTRALGNLSESVTGIDKLHSSTVQLFEALEGLEDEYGQRIGDLQKEVSKYEFNMAQLSSSVAILKEDESNHYNAIKTMRSDVSALRQESDNAKYKMAALRSEILSEEAQKIIQLANAKQETSLNNGEPIDDVNGVILHLETAVARLDARLIEQSHVINETAEKLNHKADLEHAAHWATSADMLDDKITTVAKKMELLESRMTREEEGLNSVYRQFPNDCSSMHGKPSGVYQIFPVGSESPLTVFCDMETEGGGWTTVQRHQDNDIDFNRDWTDYKHGFGQVSSDGHSNNGNFWLGNDNLHRLTTAADHPMVVRFDLWDKDGRYRYAQYETFSIDDEARLYRLHVGNQFSGNISDALHYHDGMQFSTRDADHDGSSLQCAKQYEGGWWYDHCQHVNVNGQYNIGLAWYDVDNNSWVELSRVEMKIRPSKDFRR